jgi:catalase-peroxidase
MEHGCLAPLKDWEVNNPVQLVLEVFDHIQAEFNKLSDDKKVSIADLIVLGGWQLLKKQKSAGHHVIVPQRTG